MADMALEATVLGTKSAVEAASSQYKRAQVQERGLDMAPAPEPVPGLDKGPAMVPDKVLAPVRDMAQVPALGKVR